MDKIQKILDEKVSIVNPLLVSSLLQGIDEAAIFAVLRRHFKSLDEELLLTVGELMKQQLIQTKAEFYVALGDANTVEQAKQLFYLTPPDLQLVNDATQLTMKDLLAATSYTQDYLKILVRQHAADLITLKTAKEAGWQSIIDEFADSLSAEGLSKTLAEEGWTGIVDSAGRRWHLATYADMAVKTKMTQFSVEVDREMGLKTGIDLAYISDHGSACKGCSQYEHLLISMNGLTAGYLTYEQVKATGDIFHPRCQHHLNPVRSFELVHPDVLEQHYQKITALQSKSNSVGGN